MNMHLNTHLSAIDRQQCAWLILVRPQIRLGFFMLLLLSAGVGPSLADQQAIIDAGKKEFQRYCATCHGTDAKGHGPSAEFLLAKPSNLTQLKKQQRGGVFLFWRTYDIIEGSEDAVIRGHGSREMPIWGDAFRYERDSNEQHNTGVRGRILSLVHYLESIQQK